MKVVFVVNNKNNRLAKVLPRIERYFQEHPLGSVQFFTTLREKHAVELAKRATENRCDYLIAVGGDGTLNEVVNGIMQSFVPSVQYPIVGLLPHGSANDFARMAGITSSVEELVMRIRSHQFQKIDLGKISVGKARELRYFINIAGVGLGAEVVLGLKHAKGSLGPGFDYFKSIVQGFGRYVKREVCCGSKEWQWKGRMLQMAVANGRYFGNGIGIAPHARPDDGEFEVVIFGDLSVWDYLKNLRKLQKAQSIDHPWVIYQTARELSVESETACGIEADGEYVGELPAKFSVLPNAISFLMPGPVSQ